ncbi:MAG: hypothetical protein ACI80V_001266 [Rhodothermales bacterium]|jgi:hypothetical protein
MHLSSIQPLIELGDAMLSALESGDVERFSELLEHRGELVRSLAAELQTDGLTEKSTSALDAQSARLEEAMRGSRTGLGAAVSAVSRYRSARRSYRTKPGMPDGRLNKSLHG